ncbi:MAG: carbohydrate ABC transporter substrate-binding protein [Clostridiales bacterium]|nr:carbohydrate ABC transporter substrate-binding protein [Clostridiales bacterium]
MKKLWLIFLTTIFCFVTVNGLADGLTLKTASTFAGIDAAADTYAELLKEWEDETGNMIIDQSSTSDEAWKTSVLNDFAVGNEADVLFFFAKTADSAAILNRVIPISQINEAYPQYHFEEDMNIAEADGTVYAIPVRPYWEGLFCNADLFAQYGLELPTNWENFEIAIRTFRKAGITPISVSLSDVPHYIAEFCILSAGSADDHQARPSKGEQVPQSWIDGMQLIRKLYLMGAFSDDVNATTVAEATQNFCSKKAAMQIDGSWFANSLSELGMETTVVLPFPAYSEEAEPTAYIYGVSMGFYLTRAAWMDDANRDAAVSLLNHLATGENADALGVYNISGKFLQSYESMVNNARIKNYPIQDEMQQEARGRWFGLIPGIADGSVDPAEMWAEVMNMDPFPEQ